MSHNLPAQLSSFVGREAEVTRVRELLAEGRLVTLTGAGGAGKSRLALELAGGVLDRFGDGAWLVELAPLAEPELVLPEVCAALGVEEHTLAALLDHLRERRLLLVVDNCEHLVGAVAELTEQILKACQAVRILATSREPLGVPGESTLRVPSLERDAAAQLFIQRARAAMPSFEPTSTVEQICQRLDGMPLAIELAAARVRSLSVAEIAQRLDDRFELLTSGARTALPRQQTLRATVDWSYSLLNESQQALFRMIAVFAGGWSLDALEAIGGSVAVLMQLVDRSLVSADTSTTDARYTLLETLRQYAAERLAEHGEEDAVRERHARWCVDLAERADSQLRSPDQTRWLDRLELEHDNLRSALRWSEQRGSELQVRLSNAMWQFWYIRGYLAEGQAWVDAAARRTDVSPSLRARALKSAGSLASYRYNFERAAELDRAASALARQLGDAPLLAACTMNLANAEHDLGNREEAVQLYDESLRMMRALGDTYNIGLTLLNQADLARLQGDFVKAEALLSEARPLFDRHGDARRSARCEMNIALIAYQQGDLPRADALARTALAAFRELGFKPGIADGLELLAGVAAGQGDARRAARLLGGHEALQEHVARSLSPESESAGLRQAGWQRVEVALGKAGAERERARGRALTLEQALALALEDASETQAPSSRAVLTAREQEVALLLAHGLTNREIAERLVLSERTADAHVRNIFDKLGVRARAQVAVWAASEGLISQR